jgi:hypothetical protein
MMKKLSYATYIVVGLLAILLLSRAGIIAVDGGSFSGEANSPQLKKDVSVGQIFYSHNGLSAIGIKLNTYDMREVGVLTLDVYNKPGGKKLAEVIRDDPTFPNGETIVFSFNSLSRGKYYFEVKDSGYKGKAPAVIMSNLETYNEGTAYIGKKTKGDLWFQAYRRYPFFSFLGLVSTRLSRDWFNFIPKAVYFILFGGYILLAVILVAYVVNLRLKDNS